MRPKITFLDRVQKCCGFGVASPEDVDLDADTAAFLSGWRGRYQRFLSPVFNPSSQSIKATLRRLAGTPAPQIETAVRFLDPATMAELRRAAWKQQSPGVAIPPGALKIRHRQVTPTVQELAAYALETYPKRKGNQTIISGMDHLFAVELAMRWNAANPTDRARVANPGDEPSSFQDFAWDAFARVGRRSNRKGGNCLDEASLARVLSKALKETKPRT